MATAKKTAPQESGPQRGFGWVPDLPDHRDVLYSANLRTMKALDTKVDLRKSCPPVWDQGQLGSCTAHGLGAAFQFNEMKQKKVGAFMPSRLFIYYNERVMINTVNSDSGANIRDGIKSLNTQGVCPESEWPYDDKTGAGARFIKKPTAKCYSDAMKNQVVSYQRLDNTIITQLKSCLCDGYPFVFGFTVYQSFQSIVKNGMMPMPSTTENVLGGHCVMAAGFDDTKQVFIVRNSWGPSWADKGYFYMPYAFISSKHYASDFWTIRAVE